MQGRHPEISFIIPSMTSSQGGQSPVLFIRCQFSIMLLRHEFSVVLLDTPLPVVFLLSKHSVLLLREESAVVGRVTAGALSSRKRVDVRYNKSTFN